VSIGINYHQQYLHNYKIHQLQLITKHTNAPTRNSHQEHKQLSIMLFLCNASRHDLYACGTKSPPRPSPLMPTEHHNHPE